MQSSTQKALYWAPRILTILFAAFLSIFALDVFEENQDLGKTLVAFILHLGPTFLIILILVLAWRWEWVGAIGFLLLSILYLITSWGRFHWSAYAIISGGLFLLAVLFFVSWRVRSKTT
ncbi:MAG: hypothetical protein H6563_03800 [Lewinellaceae bacterium]|nr:hypothetical protein [Lewinellaceae bacterium]